MDDVSYYQSRRVELERWLAARLPGATAVQLSPFSPATSGFSNTTLFTELAWTDGDGPHRHALVLRGRPRGQALFADYDLRLQYDVMVALHPTAVPVPTVAWYLDDPATLDVPCYFMDRVPGEVASGFRPGFHGHGLFFDASVEQRRSMWFAAVEVMADLHTLDPAQLELPPSLGPPDGPAALRRTLARIEEQLDAADADTPVLRDAVDHLRARVPAMVDTRLCWGDPRPGNIVYRDGRVVAALDWELAHFGPPEGDLAYFLLIDETIAELNGVPRLSGLPEVEETVAHYQECLGRTVENLDYQRILQALRIAAMLVLTVRLSPPQLSLPPNYLTDNFPTHRLAELLHASA